MRKYSGESPSSVKEYNTKKQVWDFFPPVKRDGFPKQVSKKNTNHTKETKQECFEHFVWFVFVGVTV
ncbi:TPA: hypothetical protein DDW35_05630 [Candidatus Sumerlaeota bacterium]|nr:hypothetical protein [Candidatus Sumerlaeota bacterium]